MNTYSAIEKEIKRHYTAPEIIVISLDKEISLVLDSDPPIKESAPRNWFDDEDSDSGY
jgi:hypothetical protein